MIDQKFKQIESKLENRLKDLEEYVMTLKENFDLRMERSEKMISELVISLKEHHELTLILRSKELQLHVAEFKLELTKRDQRIEELANEVRILRESLTDDTSSE